MTRDKSILYTSSALLAAALLCILLFAGEGGRWIAAVFWIFATVAFCLLVKKRSILFIHKKQVFWLLTLIGVLSLTILYLSGLHFGFERSTVPFSKLSLVKYILPITVSIVCSELVRCVALAQKKTLVGVCVYVACVLCELLCLPTSVMLVQGFNQFMDVVGMTLFPAVTANLLYHYLGARYGPAPNIAYRLLITLYPYVIPYAPALPDPILAFSKLGAPLLIYIFLRALYERRVRIARQKKRNAVFYVVSVCAVLASVAFVMLISCRFRFGAIVIATESMTGEINVGDAVIYERYEKQEIQEGSVIVFEREHTQVVHRVIRVERINGQTRYYTKGDANESPDSGFVTDHEIIGITNFKIAYIGYPTIWMHELFAVRL